LFILVNITVNIISQHGVRKLYGTVSNKVIEKKNSDILLGTKFFATLTVDKKIYQPNIIKYISFSILKLNRKHEKVRKPV
jgi:hypothetical protein